MVRAVGGSGPEGVRLEGEGLPRFHAAVRLAAALGIKTKSSPCSLLWRIHPRLPGNVHGGTVKCGKECKLKSLKGQNKKIFTSP